MTPLAVFFPSLMGVGILVSGALLVGDLLRKYLPQGDLRQRRAVALATFQIVDRAAGWTGRQMSPGDLLERRARRRRTYVMWASAGMVFGVAVSLATAAAYRDPLGVFYASPWMVGLGIAGAAIGAVVAGVALALCSQQVRARRSVQWLIANTIVGRLRVPEVNRSLIEVE